jgi:hypothetical protein
MKTYSQILQREVYCVRNEQEAQELVSKGVNRGEIYAEWEQVMLKHSFLHSPALALKLGEVKQLFQGTLVGGE